MERKLASVQVINNLQSIEGADRILSATVLGWQVVVTKADNFKDGDLVVFFEIDSILPDRTEFEFLRSRKFRIRTAKFKGQIAQGLVMPLSILPKTHWKEGDDVTRLLSVVKHDPQADLEARIAEEQRVRSKNKVQKFLMKYPFYRRMFEKFFGKSRDGFPSFIKKTDETRVQAYSPEVYNEYRKYYYVITEKLDGQSATYFLVKNKKRFLWFGEKYIFGVCSRNLYLPKPDNSSYWRIAKQFNIKDILSKLIREDEYIILQGEIIGEGIQKNKYKVAGLDFYAFNIVHPQGRAGQSELSWLTLLNIKQVPLLMTGIKLPLTVSELIESSKGKSTI